MTYARKSLITAAFLATTLAPLAASAATDNAMTMEKVPCSQAVAMMHGDAMKGDAMKGDAMHGGAMKGDAMHNDALKADNVKSAGDESVDAAYTFAAGAHAKSLVEMMKLEIRCGHDAKMKASAQSTLPDLQQILTTLQIF